MSRCLSKEYSEITWIIEKIMNSNITRDNATQETHETNMFNHASSNHIPTWSSKRFVGQRSFWHHRAAVNAHQLGLGIQIILHDVFRAAATTLQIRCRHSPNKRDPRGWRQTRRLDKCYINLENNKKKKLFCVPGSGLCRWCNVIKTAAKQERR